MESFPGGNTFCSEMCLYCFSDMWNTEEEVFLASAISTVNKHIYPTFVADLVQSKPVSC